MSDVPSNTIIDKNQEDDDINDPDKFAKQDNFVQVGFDGEDKALKNNLIQSIISVSSGSWAVTEDTLEILTSRMCASELGDLKGIVNDTALCGAVIKVSFFGTKPIGLRFIEHHERWDYFVINQQVICNILRSDRDISIVDIADIITGSDYQNRMQKIYFTAEARRSGNYAERYDFLRMLKKKDINSINPVSYTHLTLPTTSRV